MRGGTANTAATSWDDGYVVDVPYIEPITPDLCPAHFSMACVLHGQPPIASTRPLTWVELGSGSGASACMVAAANPDVVVWGCDFNPTHVERSRRLAAQAGLTNCLFDEASFEEVASDVRLGPSPVDVVVVHGVYSWVSPENQRHIAEFIRRRLQPGGLAYVSYEVATGWASMAPLAEAMRLATAIDRRRSDVAFPDAAAAIRRLAAGGARYFPLGPQEASQMASWSTADPRYGAHEYLSAHFRPVMFDEVAETMATARCSYVGSLEATDHLANLWVGPDLTEFVAGTMDVTLRQMLRDVIVQRPLRRDLFRRGLVSTTDIERQAWLEDLRVVGLGKPFVDGATVGVPVGEVTLDPVFYAPLVEALERAPLDVTEVQSLLPALSAADAVATLGLLVNGGYAAASRAGQAGAEATVTARQLNQVLIAENGRGGDHRCLIAPAIGAAVGSEYIEMLTLGALWDGLPPDVAALSDHALAELDRQHRLVREEGALVDDRSEARSVIERRVTKTLDRVAGVFTRLGIS